MYELFEELIEHEDFKTRVKHAAKKYKTNEKIMEQGKVYSCLYLIKSGKVRVVVHAENREYSPLRPGVEELGENNIVGEFCIMEDLPSSADIVCATDCELIQIDTPSLRAFLDNNPEISSRLLAIIATTLAGRLRHANKAIFALYLWGIKAHHLEDHLK